VLKAGLMLADISSVGFKVENFNHANMLVLEKNWGRIAETLKLTAGLAGAFGLSRDTLRADSALLPIAYYLHGRDAKPSFLTAGADAADRATIKRWLIRALIKPGIWGSGLDVLLTGLREVLREHECPRFPAELLEREMRARGKTLEFTPQEIEDLADMRCGQRDLEPLMILLFPFVDTATNQFHVDHVYPRAIFHARKLRSLGFTPEQIEELQEAKERLGNLQLLQGQLNQAKGDREPKDCMATAFASTTDREAYVSRHLIEGADADLPGFLIFYEKRRGRLIELLRQTLNG
jgi:hypothetical protein